MRSRTGYRAPSNGSHRSVAQRRRYETGSRTCGRPDVRELVREVVEPVVGLPADPLDLDVADGLKEFRAETGREATTTTRTPNWIYLYAKAVSVNMFGQYLNPDATTSIVAPWNCGIGHV